MNSPVTTDGVGVPLSYKYILPDYQSIHPPSPSPPNILGVVTFTITTLFLGSGRKETRFGLAVKPTTYSLAAPSTKMHQPVRSTNFSLFD